MLQVLSKNGIHLPQPCIQFARIVSMNKDEVKQFMEQYYKKEKEKSKTNENKPIQNKPNENESNQIVNPDDIEECKELISFENEKNAWKFVFENIVNMKNIFQNRILNCANIHCKDEMKSLDVNPTANDNNNNANNNNNNNNQSADINKIIELVTTKLQQDNNKHVLLGFQFVVVEFQHYATLIQKMNQSIAIIDDEINKKK